MGLESWKALMTHSVNGFYSIKFFHRSDSSFNGDRAVQLDNWLHNLFVGVHDRIEFENRQSGHRLDDDGNEHEDSEEDGFYEVGDKREDSNGSIKLWVIVDLYWHYATNDGVTWDNYKVFNAIFRQYQYFFPFHSQQIAPYLLLAFPQISLMLSRQEPANYRIFHFYLLDFIDSFLINFIISSLVEKFLYLFVFFISVLVRIIHVSSKDFLPSLICHFVNKKFKPLIFDFITLLLPQSQRSQDLLNYWLFNEDQVGMCLVGENTTVEDNTHNADNRLSNTVLIIVFTAKDPPLWQGCYAQHPNNPKKFYKLQLPYQLLFQNLSCKWDIVFSSTLKDIFHKVHVSQNILF